MDIGTCSLTDKRFAKWVDDACDETKLYGCMHLPSAAVLSAVLASPFALPLLVVEGDDVLGGALWWDGGTGIMVGVGPFVYEQHRRKGIGTELRKVAFDVLPKLGYSKMLGTLADDNAAGRASLNRFPVKKVGEILELDLGDV
jgi:GNAT superfamily N-acetyltransferase